MPVTYVRNDQGVFEKVGAGGATTDTTLSQAGKPADSAAVGSALTNYATTASVSAQMNTKVDKVDGKDLSTNDYTSAEKTKLAGIATGANKTVVDSSLSSSSTNPVQNKVINAALSEKSDNGHAHAASDITSGTLAVARGGTGQTTAWTNGTVTSLSNTTITSSQFAVFPYLNKAFIRLNILTPSAIAADGALFIALPSTIPTAHSALACYNEIGYDIHSGVSSNAGKGVYIMNCGTSSMPANTRLYITGWYSV